MATRSSQIKVLICGRERMSELSRIVYNKVHQKSREATREIWRSEGSRQMNFDRYPYLGINITFVCKFANGWKLDHMIYCLRRVISWAM